MNFCRSARWMSRAFLDIVMFISLFLTERNVCRWEAINRGHMDGRTQTFTIIAPGKRRRIRSLSPYPKAMRKSLDSNNTWSTISVDRWGIVWGQTMSNKYFVIGCVTFATVCHIRWVTGPIVWCSYRIPAEQGIEKSSEYLVGQLFM